MRRTSPENAATQRCSAGTFSVHKPLNTVIPPGILYHRKGRCLHGKKTLPSRRKSGREQTSAGLSRLAVPGRLPQLLEKTAHRCLRRTLGTGTDRTPSQSVCGKRPDPRHPAPQKKRKSKVCALFGAGLRKTQSIRSGFPTCLICKNTGDPAADAVVIYRLIACAALLKKEALGSLSWIIFWQCFHFYPTLCRLSSRILSAIIAMNSELVGLPRRLWMV